MSDDEKKIREVISTWLAASEVGDYAKVLGLMDDDVVFTVVGQKPFGKAEFAAASEKMKGMRFSTKSEVEEITVLESCGHAWVRTHLEVTMSIPAGPPIKRSGYTLTILRKKPDGAWIVARDANLLTADKT